MALCLIIILLVCTKYFLLLHPFFLHSHILSHAHRCLLEVFQVNNNEQSWPAVDVGLKLVLATIAGMLV